MPVWGVNSFARLPAHSGVFFEDAAQAAGYRTRRVEALETSLRPGVRVVIVSHHAVVSAPGEARWEPELFVGPNGAFLEGSPVVENTAALCAMLRSKFGACSGDPVALDRLVENAVRYAELPALEYGW